MLGAHWPVTTLVFLTTAASAFAFSNGGSEAYSQGIKYLDGGRPTAEESEAIKAMSSADRFNKGIEYLLEAEKNTTSTQDTEAVAQWLGHAYKGLAVTQGAEKDWRNAVYSMTEAVKRQPGQGTYYHWQGHFQFEAGEYWEAAQTLALARDHAKTPEDKVDATRLLIKAYMKQAQSNDPNAFDYAIKEIQAALVDHPKDFQLYYDLGECYRLKGQGGEALKAWEDGRKVPDWPEWMEKEYEKLVSAQAIKSDPGFVTDKSLHFEIQFDNKSQAANARKFQDLLEQAYEELGTKFSIRPAHKIHVTVYVGEQFSTAVKIPWAAGVAQENQIDLKVNPGWSDQDYKNIIYHEYTHHLVLLKAAQKDVPSWLNEGVAMHQEPALDTKQFYDELHTTVRKQRNWLKFAKIANGFTKLPTDRHITLAYAESHSVVGAMIDRFRFDAILKILGEMGTGQDFESTFQRVTRVSWPDFEREWFESLLQSLDKPAAATPSFDGLEGRPRPVPGQFKRGP